MGKIRVLHILHELHPSGAEMMLYNAYPYWEKDCECTILATGTDIGPFAEQLKKEGMRLPMCRQKVQEKKRNWSI